MTIDPTPRIQRYGYSLHLSGEVDNLDLRDNHVRATVEFADGAKWSANFYTLASIVRELDVERVHHIRLNGRYFSHPNLIDVNALTREHIYEIIDDLLEHDEFEQLFARVD